MKSDLPKVLHEVAGRTMAAEVLTVSRSLEPEELVMVIGHGAEQVRDKVGAEVTYALQEDQLGTGHAVAQARPHLRDEADIETVLVLYGDTPLIRRQTLQSMLARHVETNAAVTLLSFEPADPDGYGRIVRDDANQIMGIVEHKDASEEQRAITECNSGILAFEAAWLWKHLDELSLSPQGEYYLTDLVAMAVEDGRRVSGIIADDPNEVMGVNTRPHLADATRVLFERRRQTLMQNGVTLVDPDTVYIGPEVVVGQDTQIEPNVHLRGKTRIGSECHIGANSVLHDTTVGARCVVHSAHLYHVTLLDSASVGPYVNLSHQTVPGETLTI